LAKEQGGVPHYVIFPDETLKGFARIKPESLAAARRIRGVGETKAARYLPAFLATIKEFSQHQSSAGPENLQRSQSDSDASED
jgi:ATP-dependent DNA helicase RecQ